MSQQAFDRFTRRHRHACRAKTSIAPKAVTTDCRSPAHRAAYGVYCALGFVRAVRGGDFVKLRLSRSSEHAARPTQKTQREQAGANERHV